jgi:hypothetical protein
MVNLGSVLKSALVDIMKNTIDTSSKWRKLVDFSVHVYLFCLLYNI